MSKHTTKIENAKETEKEADAIASTTPKAKGIIAREIRTAGRRGKQAVSGIDRAQGEIKRILNH